MYVSHDEECTQRDLNEVQMGPSGNTIPEDAFTTIINVQCKRSSDTHPSLDCLFLSF